jgi:hypothetical protein
MVKANSGLGTRDQVSAASANEQELQISQPNDEGSDYWQTREQRLFFTASIASKFWRHSTRPGRMVRFHAQTPVPRRLKAPVVSALPAFRVQ